MNVISSKFRAVVRCVLKLKFRRNFSGAVFENENEFTPHVARSKRTSLSKLRKESELMQNLKQPKFYSVIEWNSMRSDAVCSNEVTESGFTSYCMGICYLEKNFLTAKSLLSFSNFRHESPRLAIIAMYFLICSKCYDEAGESDFLEAYKGLKDICNDFEPHTLSYAIHGLSKTSRWKECLGLLNSMEKYGRPPTSPYCSIAIAAFRNGEEDLGWNILERLYIEDRIPSSDIIHEWLKVCENDTANTSTSKIDKLIAYFRKAALSIPSSSAELIKQFVERKNLYICNYVSLPNDGLCKHCNKYLEKLEISPETFSELRDALMKSMFESQNQFLAPNKDEFHQFIKFLDEHSPFDIVIDGWSIADSSVCAANFNFNQSNNKSQKVLLQLTEQGNKRILVLAKKFMTSWISDDFKNIKTQKVVYFCTDNLARNDPYVLSAAFANGLQTLISSHGNFRDYEISLRDQRLRSLFRSWYWSHQLIKTAHNGHTQLASPITYNPTAQMTGASMHIPLHDDALSRMQVIDKAPKKWLCINRNSYSAE